MLSGIIQAGLKSILLFLVPKSVKDSQDVFTVAPVLCAGWNAELEGELECSIAI